MMGFWKKHVIDSALDEDTVRKIDEQKAWIAADPANARPYYHLAQLYRLQSRQDEALGLLLEAVRLDPKFAGVHIALAEIYIVRGDYGAAWRCARAGESLGESSAVELLTRHGIAEQA